MSWINWLDWRQSGEEFIQDLLNQAISENSLNALEIDSLKRDLNDPMSDISVVRDNLDHYFIKELISQGYLKKPLDEVIVDSLVGLWKRDIFWKCVTQHETIEYMSERTSYHLPAVQKLIFESPDIRVEWGLRTTNPSKDPRIMELKYNIDAIKSFISKSTITIWNILAILDAFDNDSWWGGWKPSVESEVSDVKDRAGKIA